MFQHRGAEELRIDDHIIMERVYSFIKKATDQLLKFTIIIVFKYRCSLLKKAKHLASLRNASHVED